MHSIYSHMYVFSVGAVGAEYAAEGSKGQAEGRKE